MLLVPANARIQSDHKDWGLSFSSALAYFWLHMKSHTTGWQSPRGRTVSYIFLFTKLYFENRIILLAYGGAENWSRGGSLRSYSCLHHPLNMNRVPSDLLWLILTWSDNLFFFLLDRRLEATFIGDIEKWGYLCLTEVTILALDTRRCPETSAYDLIGKGHTSQVDAVIAEKFQIFLWSLCSGPSYPQP